MKTRYLIFIAVLLIGTNVTQSAASQVFSSSISQPASLPGSISTNEFYAAPNGSPSGDGSLENPWDLQTAFSHPASVQPGDTVWLRGGTYYGRQVSTLSGTEQSPIVVRSYPGEWATIDTQKQLGEDDGFIILGDYVYYWDFEITNSQTETRGGTNLELKGGAFNKLINLIIHDAENNAFGNRNEIYGSILYNNGLKGSHHQHHLYTQNIDPDNPARIVDNIIFNSYAFGIHAYASGNTSQMHGVHMIGNVWFNNGVAQPYPDRRDNLILAGINGVSNILLQENMGWAAGPTTRSLTLGRYYNDNEDITLIDNYLVGKTWFANPFTTTVMTGNTFYSIDPRNINPEDYPENTFLSSAPTENEIFIRPNQYQTGRAHIVVYNWEDLNSVQIDLSGVLNAGDAYEIRNAQNYFAPPVTFGVFNGNLISLPMTGLSPAQPLYGGLINCPSECTEKAFNVFVLLPIEKSTLYLPLILK